jgi:hypothetical protein
MSRTKKIGGVRDWCGYHGSTHDASKGLPLEVGRNYGGTEAKKEIKKEHTKKQRAYQKKVTRDELNNQ